MAFPVLLGEDLVGSECKRMLLWRKEGDSYYQAVATFLRIEKPKVVGL